MNYDVLLNLRSTLRGSSNSGASSSDQSNTPQSTAQNAAPHEARPRILQGVSATNFYRNTNSSQSVKTTNDELKGKFMSMWNNMKFGWTGVRTRTSFSKEQPVWLLGRCYHRKDPVCEEASAVNFDLSGTITTEGQIAPEEPTPILTTISPSAEPCLVSPAEELGLDAAYEDNASPDDNICEDEGLEGFKRDFVTRIWMTYREKFPLMNDSNYTSDCGWGCMIRSGQMLLAEALVRHFLGRGWRFDPEILIATSSYEEALHRRIIRWFGDVKSKNCPFSIHNLVQIGKEIGKKPGDWYGPNSVAHVIRTAMKKASLEIADLENLNVYVAKDCAVYLQDIYDECIVNEKLAKAPWKKEEDTSQGTHWKSLILLVSLRLGTERLNQIYGDCLKAMLSLEYCIGIIGGRPRHSLYFVGYQEDKLIHMDPHYVQDAVDMLQDDFLLNSFHCKSPRKMKLSKMDPSCCIGFYCKTRADFDRFVSNIQQFLQPCKNWMDKQQANSGRDYAGPDISYPMFVFCKGRSKDHESELPRVYRSPVNVMSQSAYTTDASDDDDGIEEFVFI
uniref:Cysteine protease n=1 Tax=Culicoides sonorensis TaxID=179676 RepID=A0A336L0T6_CULSO